MMSQFAFPVLWCIVQVAIVSTVALIVAITMTKHRPDVAARTSGWAALIALAMTSLIPFSVPGTLLTWTANSTVRQFHGTATKEPTIESGGDTTNAVFKSQQRNLEPIAALQLNPASLLLRITNEKQVSQSVTNDVVRYVTIGLGVGIALGIARLTLGLVLLHSLRRRATLIGDVELLSLAKLLMLEMGCEQQVAIAATDEAGCAAVVGFFHPTILVSNQWSSWTFEERRTVLAHELAHVCRRDSLWRFIATVCQIIHFYNPLMRWLVARLILAQELASDRMAVSRAGGARIYLRSLSRLALDEDTRPYVRSQLSVTPVFAGYLMRRIEMLRAMDCKQNLSARGWLSFVAVASIGLFGIASTAMRGFAEAETGDKPAPVAVDISDQRNGSLNFVSTNSDEIPNQDVNTPLFQRERIPATHPAFNQFGAAHCNLALLRKSRLWPIAEIYVHELFPASVTKNWDLGSLDSILTDFVLTVRAAKSSDEQNKVMFGISGLRLLTNRDVNWRTAIHEQFKDAVDLTKDALDCIDVKFEPLGPFPIRMHGISPRELAVLTNHPVETKDLRKWLGHGEEDAQRPWSDEWNAISGGVFAVTAINRNPKEPILRNDATKEDIGPPLARLIYQNVELFSLGFDISDDSIRSQIKVRLRCYASADPELVLAATQQLLSFYGKDQAEVGGKKPPRTTDVMIDQMMSNACKSATTQLIRGDSNVIECRLPCVLPPEFLMALVKETVKEKIDNRAGQTAEKIDRSTTNQ